MNKQIILVLLIACLSSTYSLSNEVEEKSPCMHRDGFLQPRFFESKILEAIESLKVYLKNGNHNIGLPPLDPFKIENHHFETNNHFITLKSILTANSQGLSNFKVTKLSLSIFMKLNFVITFPFISGNGYYNINTTSPFLPMVVHGHGPFESHIREIVIKGKAILSTKHVHGKTIPQIHSLELDPSIAEFHLKISGLLNDEKFSEDICKSLSNNLPSMLQNNKKSINEQIAKSLPHINEMIVNSLISHENDFFRC